MKKLLVVGDSFMHPDTNFPGQHWSEMFPEYEIIMLSQSGSTNGMIAWQFFEGLKLNPDAVVLGFTEPNRIEFEATAEQQNIFKRKWLSNGHTSLTNDKKLAVDYYVALSDDRMNRFRSCVMARGLFLTCESQGIPYAYTLNGLFNNLTHLPYPSDPDVNNILKEFFHRMCATNLATYPNFKQSPGFHTDDPAWQQRFAQEAREILQQPIDNTIQIV
tara:strand:- start:1884 stop:2534 length:651 start_codon:yes stop_codon:yes gene_type:complete